MRTLVIDTATRACSVALFDGDDLIASRYDLIGRGHAEQLLVFIAELPGRGRADKVAVNVGPGSFTGIRVGISAAKALALAWDAECVGYDCLSLVAAIAINQNASDGPIDIAMMGGHGEFYFQPFAADGRAARPVASLSMEQLLATARAPIIAGDAIPAIDSFPDNQGAWEVHPDAQCWSLISALAPLLPSAIYGRAPDAKPMAVT